MDDDGAYVGPMVGIGESQLTVFLIINLTTLNPPFKRFFGPQEDIPVFNVTTPLVAKRDPSFYSQPMPSVTGGRQHSRNCLSNSRLSQRRIQRTMQLIIQTITSIRSDSTNLNPVRRVFSATYLNLTSNVVIIVQIVLQIVAGSM